MTIFDDWRDGTISDVEALHAIASDLGEIESQLAPLEAERQNLRDQLSQIVGRLGVRASVAGFGKLELTVPSLPRSYDKKRLAQLINDLSTRAPDLAQHVGSFRTESPPAAK